MSKYSYGSDLCNDLSVDLRNLMNPKLSFHNYQQNAFHGQTILSTHHLFIRNKQHRFTGDEIIVEALSTTTFKERNVK